MHRVSRFCLALFVGASACASLAASAQGHWKVVYACSGTVTPPSGNAVAWAPANANGYTSAVFTYGTNAAISGSGTITATLTWVDAHGNRAANPPKLVNIRETSTADAAIWGLGVTPPISTDPGPALAHGANMLAAPMDSGSATVTATADNGEGDAAVALNVAGYYCAQSYGRHYFTVDGSSGTITRTVHVSSSASATNSPLGSLYTSFSFTVDALTCVHPCNMTLVKAGADVDTGDLVLSYTWESTDGNLQSLTHCYEYEYVTYPGQGDPITKTLPKPPYNTDSPDWMFPNPTDGRKWSKVPGSDGKVDDEHLHGPYIKSYSPQTLTAIQNYRFNCAICMSKDEFQILLGPLTIVRFLEQLDGGQWRYRITKGALEATLPIN